MKRWVGEIVVVVALLSAIVLVAGVSSPMITTGEFTPKSSFWAALDAIVITTIMFGALLFVLFGIALWLGELVVKLWRK